MTRNLSEGFGIQIHWTTHCMTNFVFKCRDPIVYEIYIIRDH